MDNGHKAMRAPTVFSPPVAPWVENKPWGHPGSGLPHVCGQTFGCGDLRSVLHRNPVSPYIEH